MNNLPSANYRTKCKPAPKHGQKQIWATHKVTGEETHIGNYQPITKVAFYYEWKDDGSNDTTHRFNAYDVTLKEAKALLLANYFHGMRGCAEVIHGTRPW
ncbi:hypothetical protein DRQ50_00200 [bacterium]|nr:MAG: hypothetical protein DRQ50_00200 [bacterium]